MGMMGRLGMMGKVLRPEEVKVEREDGKIKKELKYKLGDDVGPGMLMMRGTRRPREIEIEKKNGKLQEIEFDFKDDSYDE